MPVYKYRILSTKEIDAALLQTAAASDIEIVTQAFISISFVQTQALRDKVNDLLGQRIIAVFTSANAVNAVAALGNTARANWELYCLPGATIEAVQQHFPNSTIAGTAVSSAALALILLQREAPAVVFFCGSIRRDELPVTMKAHQVPLEEVVVYETTELKGTANGAFDGVLFYSPSGIKSYFTHNTPAPGTVCFAIGDTTASVLREYTNNTIIASKAATATALVDTAIHYFNNQS